MRLPGRTVNRGLTTPDREVLRIETVACSAGDRFSLAFESAESRWRQGVWLAVDGELVVDGQTASQVVLWRDTAPNQVQLEVRSTGDGLMRAVQRLELRPGPRAVGVSKSHERNGP